MTSWYAPSATPPPAEAPFLILGSEAIETNLLHWESWEFRWPKFSGFRNWSWSYSLHPSRPSLQIRRRRHPEMNSSRKMDRKPDKCQMEIRKSNRVYNMHCNRPRWNRNLIPTDNGFNTLAKLVTSTAKHHNRTQCNRKTIMASTNIQIRKVTLNQPPRQKYIHPTVAGRFSSASLGASTSQSANDVWWRKAMFVTFLPPFTFHVPTQTRNDDGVTKSWRINRNSTKSLFFFVRERLVGQRTHDLRFKDLLQKPVSKPSPPSLRHFV